MSNDVRYVFSTKYLGGGKAFSKRRSLDDHSPIRKYLETHFSEVADLWEWFKVYVKSFSDGVPVDVQSKFDQDFSEFVGNNAETKDWFATWYGSLNDEDKQALLKLMIESGQVSYKMNEELKSCPCDGSKVASRFSYFVLGEDENSEAYAVPYLEWKANLEWIRALIEDPFGKDADQQREIYLVLHDNDLPGYEGTPFKILDADEIFALFYPGGDRNRFIVQQNNGENVFFYDEKYKVHIIVFQHTWNDAVEILQDEGISYSKISNQLGANNIIVNSIFHDASIDQKELFRLLSVNASVDVCSNSVNEDLIEPRCFSLIEGTGQSNPDKYYIYKDNGALLSEFMHVKTELQTSVQVKNFINILRKTALGEKESEALRKMRFPVIVIYRAFFDDWADAVPDKRDSISSHRNNLAMKENLERVFSFLNNSSIWVRLVDNRNTNAFDTAVREFEYFHRIGLYQYDSAWENLEFNTRSFAENYLVSSVGGHGSYVTPLLSGDETKALECLNRNSDFMDSFNDVALRILLVDDKVGSCNEDLFCHGCFSDSEGQITLSVVACDDIRDCTLSDKCKLCTIKRLMDDGSQKDGKTGLFGGEDKRMPFYWKGKKIECYYCPTITRDFLGGELSFDDIVFEPVFVHDKDKTEEKASKPAVQIVGVHDIRTALLLLSRYKFDMLFFDYLLDWKDAKSEEREYSRQFFDFLSTDFAEMEESADEDKQKKYRALEKLRCDVLYNRGPLDRFWIMPVTGFNQTFIQDIYRNRVNLIDHRWNISNGADPISTPWQFLYHLNKFIELQLKSCLYQMNDLLDFLQNICKDIRELEHKEGKSLGFYDFQSFMGSAFANFIRRYGNRHLIQRDAYWDIGKKNRENKSVFATYVWKQLYANSKYRNEIELNRLIQKFLHHASTIHNDRYGRQRLEEAFGQLCFFVETNKIVQEHLSFQGKGFHEDLLYLRRIMDRLTKPSGKNDSERNE